MNMDYDNDADFDEADWMNKVEAAETGEDLEAVLDGLEEIAFLSDAEISECLKAEEASCRIAAPSPRRGR